jgi:hypothetical protein
MHATTSQATITSSTLTAASFSLGTGAAAHPAAPLRDRGAPRRLSDRKEDSARSRSLGRPDRLAAAGRPRAVCGAPSRQASRRDTAEPGDAQPRCHASAVDGRVRRHVSRGAHSALPRPILVCLLVGMAATGLYVVLLGVKYGWAELRAPEAWAVAVLVGVGMFLIAMLHPAWMPRDIWSPSGAR